MSEDSVSNLPEINVDDFEYAPMEILEDPAYNSKDYIRYMCFFSGLDIGLVQLKSNPFPLKSKQSFSLSLNILEFKKQVVENRLGAFTGLSLNYSQLGFKDNFTFIQSLGSNVIVPLPDTLNYSRNQLRMFAVSVPLMVEINRKNTFENNFHLAFGLQGQYRYAVSTFHEHSTSEATIIQRNSEEIGVNRLSLEACIRAGFQNFTVFASQSLTPLFNPALFQEQLFPTVIGITFVPSNSKPTDSFESDF